MFETYSIETDIEFWNYFRLMKLAADMGNLLDLLGSSEGSMIMDEVRHNIVTQLYQNYQAMKFFNIHLGIINSK